LWISSTGFYLGWYWKEEQIHPTIEMGPASYNRIYELESMSHLLKGRLQLCFAKHHTVSHSYFNFLSESRFVITSEARVSEAPGVVIFKSCKIHSPVAFGGSINIRRFWDRRMEYE